MGRKKGKNGTQKEKEKNSPSTPPPEPQPEPQPELSLWQTSQEVEEQYQAARTECDPKLHINFMTVLNRLVDAGIVKDRNNLLRTKASFKKSWDAGMLSSLRYEYDSLYCGLPWYDRRMKRKIQRYMHFAALHKYFEVPDPKYRLKEMFLGFFTIYPDGKDQTDPVFHERDNVDQIAKLIPMITDGAIKYHNFMTNSELILKEAIKANLFLAFLKKFYFFITLEAFTNESREKTVTCRCRVLCIVDGHNGWPRLPKKPIPIRITYVESFHVETK